MMTPVGRGDQLCTARNTQGTTGPHSETSSRPGPRGTAHPGQEPRGRGGGHTTSSGVRWLANTHETPSGASRTTRGGSAGDRDACEQVGGQHGDGGTGSPFACIPSI